MASLWAVQWRGPAYDSVVSYVNGFTAKEILAGCVLMRVLDIEWLSLRILQSSEKGSAYKTTEFLFFTTWI